jgi:hypothetical protein
VHVDVDEAGRGEVVGRIQNVPSRIRRELARHRDDSARLDRHVAAFGQALRRVHHHPVPDHEIVHRPSGLLCRAIG